MISGEATFSITFKVYTHARSMSETNSSQARHQLARPVLFAQVTQAQLNPDDVQSLSLDVLLFPLANRRSLGLTFHNRSCPDDH